MKHEAKYIGAMAGLCILLYAASCGLTSCSNVGSVGVEGGYTPSTGEITVGIMITFKQDLFPGTAEALIQAGAQALNSRVWVFASVTNEVQRLAVNRALMEGAELTAVPKP